MDVYKVEKNQIADYWPLIRKHILFAIEKTKVIEKTPLDFYLLWLYSGRFHAWAIIDNDELIACQLTEIVEYPNGSSLVLNAMGGYEMSEWAKLLHDAMEKFAKEEGCKWIESGVRPGLSRKYASDYGFLKNYTTYSKEINYAS